MRVTGLHRYSFDRLTSFECNWRDGVARLFGRVGARTPQANRPHTDDVDVLANWVRADDFDRLVVLTLPGFGEFDRRQLVFLVSNADRHRVCATRRCAVLVLERALDAHCSVPLRIRELDSRCALNELC